MHFRIVLCGLCSAGIEPYHCFYRWYCAF